MKLIVASLVLFLSVPSSTGQKIGFYIPSQSQGWETPGLGHLAYHQNCSQIGDKIGDRLVAVNLLRGIPGNYEVVDTVASLDCASSKTNYFFPVPDVSPGQYVLRAETTPEASYSESFNITKVPPEKPTQTKKIFSGIIIAVSVIFLLLMSWTLFRNCKKRRPKPSQNNNDIPLDPPRYQETSNDESQPAPPYSPRDYNANINNTTNTRA